VRYYTER